MSQSSDRVSGFCADVINTGLLCKLGADTVPIDAAGPVAVTTVHDINQDHIGGWRGFKGRG